MGIRSVASATVLAASVIIGAVALSGCAAPQAPAPQSPAPQSSAESGAGSSSATDSGSAAQGDPIALLASFGIEAGSGSAGGADSDQADPAAIVATLDELPLSDRPEDLATSITATELRIQPDTPDEATVPLEGDDFYLSIAPYRDETHPCTFHSPTGCVGELRSTPIELRVTDAESGEVVVERAAETADNGFVGLWLPRDREYEIEVVSDGDRGIETVRTGDGDPTCITTLRLG